MTRYRYWQPARITIASPSEPPPSAAIFQLLSELCYLRASYSKTPFSISTIVLIISIMSSNRFQQVSQGWFVDPANMRMRRPASSLALFGFVFFNPSLMRHRFTLTNTDILSTKGHRKESHCEARRAAAISNATDEITPVVLLF